MRKESRLYGRRRHRRYCSKTKCSLFFSQTGIGRCSTASFLLIMMAFLTPFSTYCHLPYYLEWVIGGSCSTLCFGKFQPLLKGGGTTHTKGDMELKSQMIKQLPQTSCPESPSYKMQGPERLQLPRRILHLLQNRSNSTHKCPTALQATSCGENAGKTTSSCRIRFHNFTFVRVISKVEGESGKIAMEKNRRTTEKIAPLAKKMRKSQDVVLPGVYEGGKALWSCTGDLIKFFEESKKLNDDPPSTDDDRQRKRPTIPKNPFAGKNVLELGCGHGAGAVYAHQNRAAKIAVQDFNEEVLRDVTIPTLLYNIFNITAHCYVNPPSQNTTNCIPTTSSSFTSHASTDINGSMNNLHQSSPSSSSSSLSQSAPDFFVGPWGADLSKYILNHQTATTTATTTTTTTTTTTSSNSSSSHTPPSYRYDIILAADTLYSPKSIADFILTVKMLLEPKQGRAYIATQRYYFGLGGGLLKLKEVVRKDKSITLRECCDYVTGTGVTKTIVCLAHKKKQI